jgi:hypothetical protein
MENTNPWAKAGVMIREKWTPYSKYAAVFMTPGNGVTFQWRQTEDGPSSSINKNGVTVPQYVKLERTVSGNFIAKHSSNALIWSDVNDPGETPQQPLIPMGTEDPNLYIGTAVTSHDALVTCTADFNNVLAAPSPTNWIFGNIGTNDPEQLYVALSDGATTAVVNHPDPNAATLTDWQEWNILLTAFGGINLNNITKVHIGLGDRVTHPDPGGSGAIYVDDLRACPPRCVASLAKPLYDIAVPYDCVVDEKDLLILAGEWLNENTEVRDWNRVAYWDAAYPTGWADLEVTEAVRDYLVLNGYTVVDANELKTWMDARIADGALSVVVFCKDIVPDTVAETQDPNCTIRKYLDAGGKVVWYADWPFYYRGFSDGTTVTWGANGAINILGFDASGGPNDSGEEVAFTPAGIVWGLTTTWTSSRPTPPTITQNLTALATISGGSAAAWAKHYVQGDTYRGFVRLADFDVTTSSPVALIGDLLRVAEYKGALATDWYIDNVINLKDYSVFANHYLDEVLWP